MKTFNKFLYSLVKKGITEIQVPLVLERKDGTLV